MDETPDNQPLIVEPVRFTGALLFSAAIGFLATGPALSPSTSLLAIHTPAEPLEWILFAAQSVLFGIALPGVWFTWPRSRNRHRPDWGRMSWFMLSLASWLLMPPAIYGRYRGLLVADADRVEIAQGCLFTTTPAAALLLLVGLLIAGKLQKGWRDWWRADTIERVGRFMILAWASCGAWDCFFSLQELAWSELQPLVTS